MSIRETAVDTPNAMAYVREASAQFSREHELTEPQAKLLSLAGLGRADRVICAELELDEPGLEALRAEFEARTKLTLKEAVSQVTKAALTSLNSVKS